MPKDPFVSFAPDRQDVVLWRALGCLPDVRYLDTAMVDTGALLTGLAARGWVSSRLPGHPAPDVVGLPVHVMVVEGGQAEADELLALEPWVVVLRVEAPATTAAGPWLTALTSAGYSPCLFDGVTRFFVAPKHADDLGAALSYPACSRDGFVDHETESLRSQRGALVEDVFRWRSLALEGWAADRGQNTRGVQHESSSVAAAQREIDAIRSTLSWRITAPLRKLRGLGRR